MPESHHSGSNLIPGSTGDWEVVIGLEVHAQVASESKLFSSASTAFGAEPNTQVSLVDAAMPGMLPVINEYCVEQAVRTGLGLNAQINERSIFDRKNYFYPDLPQGYQISQYKHPIVGSGEVEVDLEGGAPFKVGIERLHLEQDAGKSIHDLIADRTAVDLNRAGVALMEIVTKPDIRSAAQAAAFVRKLRTILRYLGTCDGNMEQGSLRADVNVSVRQPDRPLGIRCEIKNVNSVKFIVQAIEFEAQRQIEILEAGGNIQQETRLFDPQSGETFPMRSKEEAHDYRYFPDPDLPPLVLESAWIDGIRKALPELPDAKKARFIRDFGLSDYDAEVLSAERERAEFFEIAALGRDAKKAANWITGPLLAELNSKGLPIAESPVSPTELGSLIDLIEAGRISGRIAKDVFQRMCESGDDPAQIVKEGGLEQVSDESVIEMEIDKIIEANPDKARQVKDKPKLLGWFVGQVMQATGGKANPQKVNDILRSKLERDES